MVLSKLFRSDTIMGIEITSSQIILVEADASSWPVRIRNFALIDVFTPYKDNIAQQIKGVLENNWFKGRRVNIAISHPSVIHRPISLPPHARR